MHVEVVLRSVTASIAIRVRVCCRTSPCVSEVTQHKYGLIGNQHFRHHTRNSDLDDRTSYTRLLKAMSKPNKLET
jgi:hypothetical protein